MARPADDDRKVNNTYLKEKCGMSHSEYLGQAVWSNEFCPDASAVWEAASDQLDTMVHLAVVVTNAKQKSLIFSRNHSGEWRKTDRLNQRCHTLTLPRETVSQGIELIRMYFFEKVRVYFHPAGVFATASEKIYHDLVQQHKYVSLLGHH